MAAVAAAAPLRDLRDAHRRPDALERVMGEVRAKWGQGSIVRLESAGALSKAARRPAARERPPWWPLALPDGSVVRPTALEVVASPGSGRLTLALAWLAAARPTLAAVVQPAVESERTGKMRGSGRSFTPRGIGGLGGILSPPSAALAGADLERLLLIRPPDGPPRLSLDAVAVLLRSEAFDVVVCTLPAHARLSTLFAGKLASLAARSGTSLVLLTQPPPAAPVYIPSPKRFNAPFSVIEGGASPVNPAPDDTRALGAGLLGAFADYRITLAGTRWSWAHRQLTGVKLRVHTDRARAAEDGASLTHEVTLAAGQPARFKTLSEPAATAQQDDAQQQVAHARHAGHAEQPQHGDGEERQDDRVLKVLQKPLVGHVPPEGTVGTKRETNELRPAASQQKGWLRAVKA